MGEAVDIIVGAIATAPQDDVAVVVTFGGNNCRYTLFGYREKMMRMPRGFNGIDGNLYVSVGGILEANRAGESRGQFAMHLAFGGAGTNGSPANEIADKLGHDSIEKLAARREAHVCQIEQESSCHMKPFVDAEGSINERVVNKPFPADIGTRFFEIDSHNDEKIICKAVGLLFESERILFSCFCIVDRAWARNDNKAIVTTV